MRVALPDGSPQLTDALPDVVVALLALGAHPVVVFCAAALARGAPLAMCGGLGVVLASASSSSCTDAASASSSSCTDAASASACTASASCCTDSASASSCTDSASESSSRTDPASSSPCTDWALGIFQRRLCALRLCAVRISGALFAMRMLRIICAVRMLGAPCAMRLLRVPLCAV
mmetsp:Transcript_28689/g.87920  ORF Transcript_28689/g.87920 Transcript_28689/m.87920 type:complete len:176 (+) Transcript_28689:89-616(+)